MKTPHILLAASNVAKMRRNIEHLLDPAGRRAIDAEIATNVVGLFELGVQHHQFAMRLNASEWRQIISRLYYGAYNVQRAVRLEDNGAYSTDSTDHKKIDDVPAAFPNLSTYRVQLPLLREDRNLADYDHSATVDDLVIALPDARQLVTDFINDARGYLRARGAAL